MKLNKTIIKPLGGLILNGGIYCLATAATSGAAPLLTGSASVIASLAGAITGNLASNYVGTLIKLDYNKLVERLEKTNSTNADHDLDRLFRQSAIIALEYIKTLFLTQILEDSRVEDLSKKDRKEFMQGLNVFFDENIEDLKLIIKDNNTAIDKNLINDPSSYLDDLITEIFKLTLVKFDTETERVLKAFYADKLPYCFELAFKEALKNDDLGFKAFQIWILEDLHDQNIHVLQGQQHLLDAINNLKERKIDYLSKEDAGQKAEEQAQIIYSLLAQDFIGIKHTLTNLADEININFEKQYKISLLTYDKVSGIDVTVTQIKQTVDALAENNTTNKKIYPPKLNLIPRHTDEFIGRENDLEKLAKELENSSKVVLVNGIGGIGKTTLAKKYLQIYAKDYNHVAWVEIKQNDLIKSNYNGEQAFIDAFAYDKTLWSNGLRLEMDDNTSLEERFQSIIHALNNMDGKNLLVIDNAGEEIKKFNKILPTPPSWHVLVTSRNILSGFTPYYLDKLEKSKAIELFKTWYDADEKQIEALLEETDYHTLMIEMLAKTLQAYKQRLTIEYLTEKLKTGHLDDVKLQRRIEVSHTGEETILLKHLLLTFRLTALNETEIFLLKNFYFLLPQYHKLDSILVLLQVDEENENNIIDILDNLVQKGWLSREDNFYAMHRLIQQVIYYQLNPGLNDAEILLKSFKKLTYTDAYSDKTIAIEYIPYIEHLLKKVPEEDFNTEYQLSLLINMGALYINIQEFRKAENLFIQALKIYSCLAQNNPAVFEKDVAMTLNNIGILYINIQEYEKAKDSFIQALEIYSCLAQNNPAAFEPDVVKTLNNLGNFYINIQEYEKAKNAYTQALEIIKRLAQNNAAAFEPDVAMTLNNLGNLYIRILEYEKAENSFTLALEIRKRLAQNNTAAFEPAVATTLNNMGILYSNIKEYEKAENSFTQTLEIYSRLAQNNIVAFEPVIATTLNNMGTFYINIMEYGKAENAFILALEIRKRLAQNNPAALKPSVAMTFSNLGNLYSNIQEYEKAENAYTQALEIRLEYLSRQPHTWNVVVTLYLLLADIYQILKQSSKALEAIKKGLINLLLYFDAQEKTNYYINYARTVVNHYGLDFEKFWNEEVLAEVEKIRKEDSSTH